MLDLVLIVRTFDTCLCNNEVACISFSPFVVTDKDFGCCLCCLSTIDIAIKKGKHNPQPMLSETQLISTKLLYVRGHIIVQLISTNLGQEYYCNFNAKE